MKSFPENWAGNAESVRAGHRGTCGRAFTLTELLAVMVIIILLLSLIVPAIRSLLEANNLQRASQIVADRIGLARQIASARNCTVEVRLIRDPTVLTSSNGYNLIQLWKPAAASASGTTAQTLVPADKPYVLPATAAIAGDVQAPGLSPLLTNLPQNQTLVMPGHGTTALPYAAFQLKPSGEVAPIYDSSGAAAGAGPAMTSVYLTIVPSRTLGSTGLPVNYSIVQINPYIGTTAVFRP